MRYGVQGFGVLKCTDMELSELFTKIKEAGYSHFEPCISFFKMDEMERMIWYAEEYEKYAEEFLKAGLKVESCHIFSQNLFTDADKIIELSKRYGIRQFVVKSPSDLSDISLHKTAMYYMTLADRLSEIGAELLIHNEAEDIQTRIHGKTAYEYLLDLCLGKVYAQVDAGWMMYGGVDPIAFLWRNSLRVKSLHLKDFKGKEEVSIGDGDLPLEACYQFARAMGLVQISDSDSFAGNSVVETLKNTAMKLQGLSQSRENSVSYLNTYNIKTGEIKVLHKFDRVIEAPNWRHTANEMIVNSEGRLYRYNIDTDTEELIDTGICQMCNNDHVLSSDEKYIALSDSTTKEGELFASHIYIVPIEGGEARLVTENSPSFLHGWSPDGKTLSYCAFRMQDDGLQVDVYGIEAEIDETGKISVGKEYRITDGGFNDGPEFSPDGDYIYFNSTRSGLMQAYCMKADGSERTQITDNERNNWFPHISPDGKKIVYLSYRKNDLAPNEHLPNMQVELWLMNADGTDKHRLLSFFGGQGSINVNSWNADSSEFAFVSYGYTHV